MTEDETKRMWRELEAYRTDRPFKEWPKEAQDRLASDLSTQPSNWMLWLDQATAEQILRVFCAAGSHDSQGRVLVVTCDWFLKQIEQAKLASYQAGFNAGWAKAWVRARQQKKHWLRWFFLGALVMVFWLLAR